jgi:hypothetical protein
LISFQVRANSSLHAVSRQSGLGLKIDALAMVRAFRVIRPLRAINRSDPTAPACVHERWHQVALSTHLAKSDI